MELTKRINLIWYGRGNDLSADCESFSLSSDSNIEIVYHVADNGSGWQSWDSAVTDAQVVEKLECGNLYLIILKIDGGVVQSIDIPEAIIDGTLKVGDENLSVLPNNVQDTTPVVEEPEPEVDATCLPTNEYTIYSKPADGSEFATSGGETYGQDGILSNSAVLLGLKDDDKLTSPVTQGNSINLVFTTLENATYSVYAEPFGTDTTVRINVQSSDFESFVGCWEGTGTDTINLSKVETQDSSTTPSNGNDQTENEVTAESCFADLEGKTATHKLVYTPNGGDSVTIDNFKLCTTTGAYTNTNILDETGEESLGKAFKEWISETEFYESFTSTPTVDFAIYMNNLVVTEASGTLSIPQLIYPTEESKISKTSDTTANQVTGSFVGLKVFDEAREAGSCDWISSEGIGEGIGDSV